MKKEAIKIYYFLNFTSVRHPDSRSRHSLLRFALNRWISLKYFRFLWFQEIKFSCLKWLLNCTIHLRVKSLLFFTCVIHINAQVLTYFTSLDGVIFKKHHSSLSCSDLFYGRENMSVEMVSRPPGTDSEWRYEVSLFLNVFEILFCYWYPLKILVPVCYRLIRTFNANSSNGKRIQPWKEIIPSLYECIAKILISV